MTGRPSLSAFARLTAVGLVCAAGFAAPAVSAHAGPVAASVKPGRSGATITLSKSVELTPGSYDIATDSVGTTYLGWLATDATGQDDGELLHLCVLPPHATACQRGIQTTAPSSDFGDDNWLKVLAPPAGPVSLLWYDQVGSTSEIAEATVHGGVLGRADDVSPAPTNGELLDAEVSPDGDIWTVCAGGSGHSIVVRDQLGNPTATTIKTPADVDFARLAFSGTTPIIAMHVRGSRRDPVRYTYLFDGSWTTVARVTGTQTGGADLGLVRTGAGVRLAAVNSLLAPVIAKWNGHGFGPPTVVDTATTDPDGLDLVADASGRAADASYVNQTVAVTNIADSTHGAVVTVPVHGTPAGGDAQLTTNPSGAGWVAWAVASGVGDEDTLRVTPVLLPALRRSASRTGARGTVTLTGPVSCQPPDSTAVRVAGHARKGWSVSSRTVTLGAEAQGRTLDGATLTAGKAYTLNGSVVFVRGHLRSKVTVSLTFSSCPTP